MISQNWILSMETEGDKKYMSPLFEFLLQQFIEIFGEKALESEKCKVYNDPTADCPMLVTNDAPIRLRTCLESLQYWAQYIYQVSHELTHYIIRQYKENKELYVKWFEETLCEAMSLYILKASSLRWQECSLSNCNPQYGASIMHYFEKTYNETGPSSLKKCRSFDELKKIENSCEENRISRSIERNFLTDTFCERPENISAFVWYTRYMRGDLLIDFKKWKENDSNPLISKLEAIQPNLES